MKQIYMKQKQELQYSLLAIYRPLFVEVCVNTHITRVMYYEPCL